MKIHPISTLLGGTGEGLDTAVHTLDEISIAMHRWITEDNDYITKFMNAHQKDLQKVM